MRSSWVFLHCDIDTFTFFHHCTRFVFSRSNPQYTCLHSLDPSSSNCLSFNGAHDPSTLHLHSQHIQLRVWNTHHAHSAWSDDLLFKYKALQEIRIVIFILTGDYKWFMACLLGVVWGCLDGLSSKEKSWLSPCLWTMMLGQTAKADICPANILIPN